MFKMDRKCIAAFFVLILTVGAEVQAAQYRAAATESANRQAAVQLVSDGPAAGASSQSASDDISTLENLELPPSNLPPGFPTVNLTQLAPLIPLLAGLNATVLSSWVPVVERTPPEGLALTVPAINAINASTLEALLAALPYLNWETVIAVLPLVNELPADTLASYLKLVADIEPEFLAALIPGIVQLDPVWINKVVPAVLKAFDADYLIRLVNAIAPTLSQVNPDLIVALLPAVNTISLETWQLLIEILNALTVPMLQLLVHLLNVFGPLLDGMSRILTVKRRILPVDVSNYMGKITKFTKPPGTLGMQPSSIIFARKVIPGSPPNNGAPPAPLPPPVPALPRTLNGTYSGPSRNNSSNSTVTVRSLLSFTHF